MIAVGQEYSSGTETHVVNKVLRVAAEHDDVHDSFFPCTGIPSTSVNGSEYLDSVECYVPSQLSWIFMPTLPIPFSNRRSRPSSNEIYSYQCQVLHIVTTCSIGVVLELVELVL